MIYIQRFKKPLLGLVALTFLYGSMQIGRKPEYYKLLLKETVKIALDSVSTNSLELKDTELYMDTHMHIRKPKNNPKAIEDIVETMMDKIDITVIMQHNLNTSSELDYEYFKSKVKENPKYQIKDYGNYMTITSKDDMLIAIKAQELGTNTGRDVLAIGHDGKIKPYQSPEKTIIDIHEQGGIAIIAHPMSIRRKSLIPYSTPNEEEKKTLEELCQKADAIEEFNSQNYLWMYRSNVLADLFAKKHNFSGTAGSDTHGVLEQIGLSGIIIDKDKLDTDNLIESLRDIIKNKKFRTHKEYTDFGMFYKVFLGPYLKNTRKLANAR